MVHKDRKWRKSASDTFLDVPAAMGSWEPLYLWRSRFSFLSEILYRICRRFFRSSSRSRPFYSFYKPATFFCVYLSMKLFLSEYFIRRTAVFPCTVELNAVQEILSPRNLPQELRGRKRANEKAKRNERNYTEDFRSIPLFLHTFLPPFLCLLLLTSSIFSTSSSCAWKG